MEYLELEELRKRKRSQMAALSEVEDLTRQLAAALDRRDEVSVQMLLNMREEPIRRLQELDDGIRNYLENLPPEHAVQGAALMQGGEAQDPVEIPLCEDVARFRRLLSSVVEIDKRFNLRLGNDRSFYKTFR